MAFGDLLSSVAGAAGAVPERSSVLKNFPACSLETVAPCATACQLTDTSNRNGSSVSRIVNALPATGILSGIADPRSRPAQPKCRSGTPW